MTDQRTSDQCDHMQGGLNVMSETRLPDGLFWWLCEKCGEPRRPVVGTINEQRPSNPLAAPHDSGCPFPTFDGDCTCGQTNEQIAMALLPALNAAGWNLHGNLIAAVLDALDAYRAAGSDA